MKHKFSIEYLANAPLIKVDFRMMEHAISNVVLNAALYTPEGSEVKISTHVNQGMFTIKIQDNGFGVSDENKEKIFKKFYRIPGSPTGGTGLGLSIVKSIVELHKGNIKVVDNPLYPP